MSRAATVFALLLVLLMQSQAAVWAAAAQPARAPAPEASETAAMPCHGGAEASAVGDHGSGAHGAMDMDCCDDGEACGSCAAACVAAPALPAGAAQLADYVEAHFASVWQAESVLIPPPLDLLRPPITLLR